MGMLGHHAGLVTWLSEVYRLVGSGDEAWQHAHQALDLARRQKDRGNEALALHQLGAVHAHADSPDVAQAEAHYRQALALADALGMRPLVAHCHAGLGTLYTSWEQACTELAAAIALYRAMAMTFWLPQTEATLAQVLEMFPEVAHPTEGPMRHLTVPVQFTKTPGVCNVTSNG
jgi:hypothetical protein